MKRVFHSTSEPKDDRQLKMSSSGDFGYTKRFVSKRAVDQPASSSIPASTGHLQTGTSVLKDAFFPPRKPLPDEKTSKISKPTSTASGRMNTKSSTAAPSTTKLPSAVTAAASRGKSSPVHGNPNVIETAHFYSKLRILLLLL